MDGFKLSKSALGIFAIFLIVISGIDICLGSVNISFSEVLSILFNYGTPDRTHKEIVLLLRLPRVSTACLAGMGLSISGLLMQTLFRNPLAGPFVLGITSGASLGVALLLMLNTLLLGLGISFITNTWSISLAAALGAFGILLVIGLLAEKLRNNMMLLLIGLMFGYISGALVGALQFYGDAGKVKDFVIWGLGSFSKTNYQELAVLSVLVLLGVFSAFLLSKQLNILLSGEDAAKSLGLNLKRNRLLIILVTGVLSGVITAFCGPIAFVGIAVPHLARVLMKSQRHQILIPATLLIGAIIAVGCDLIAQLPGTNTVLPVNVVTCLIGAPIVIWVIFRYKRQQYMS